MGVFETIEASGITSRLYAAGDAGPGTPGVVVFHPWWGLNDDVVAYADRLAAAGFAVVAPDLYRGPVASTIEEAERLSASIDEAAADGIALATIDGLADRLGPAARLAVLGFSMGGAWSMWSPAERDRLVASVVYYGSIEGRASAGRRSPSSGTSPRRTRTSPTRRSLHSRTRSGRPGATSSSTGTRGPGTGSQSRRVTPTAPLPPTVLSSVRSPSSTAISGRRPADLSDRPTARVLSRASPAPQRVPAAFDKVATSSEPSNDEGPIG